MGLEPLTRVCCTICGSEDVVADANVVWNVQLQEWEIEQVWEKGGCCPACETYDARWEHRPLEEEDNATGSDTKPSVERRGDNASMHDRMATIRDRQHNIRGSKVSTELGPSESDSSS